MYAPGHYLFWEANSSLSENFELWGTNNVQRQISHHIFKAKWRLLCLLSFKYFSQHTLVELYHQISRRVLAGHNQSCDVLQPVIIAFKWKYFMDYNVQCYQLVGFDQYDKATELHIFHSCVILNKWPQTILNELNLKLMTHVLPNCTHCCFQFWWQCF